MDNAIAPIGNIKFDIEVALGSLYENSLNYHTFVLKH